MHRRSLLSALGAVVATIAVATRWPRSRAQDVATPAASPAATPESFVNAVLMDRQRRRLGTATLTEGPDGQITLGFSIEEGMLEPDQYQLMLHETGICDPSGAVPFSSAGMADPDGPSASLGTLTVENGATTFEMSSEAVSLELLNDRDGSALVIHRVADDGSVDPVSSERVACGVVYPPAESEPRPATPAAATPVGEGEQTDEPQTEVTVEMIDIDFNPNEFTIPANTDVTVHLPNSGATIHNFHIDELDVHSEDVPPGEETTVTINAEPGDYEYYCSIPGHREAGMVGTVHIE